MFFSKKRLLQQGSFSYVSNAFYVFVKRNERRSVAKKGKIRLSLFYVKTVNRYKNIIVKLFPSGNNVVFGLNKKLYIYPSLSLVIICLFTLIFYKHMNFLAEAFAKHILCLFFRPKPSCAMCSIFLKKKSLHVLIQPSELHWTKPFFGQIVLVMCLFFSTKAFMCYVLNFFEKKPSCAYGAMCLLKMRVQEKS